MLEKERFRLQDVGEHCEKYNDVSTFPPFWGIMCHVMPFSWREKETEIKMEHCMSCLECLYL